MKDRSALLIKIRPAVGFDKNTNSAEFERFQNETLRPILKFQNDWLLSYFHLDLGNIPLPKGSRDQSTFIEDRLKKNHALKNTLIGSTIGYFTEEEFIFYRENMSEINKRIMLLIIQRIQDGV